jgi:3-isopropylmalate/(R)-2-methylmalate dehydratase large subunit
MTLFQKIWDAHVVATRPEGTALLYIDRHLLHEGSRHAFEMLRQAGRGVRRPRLTFAFADHLVPTRNQAAGVEGIANEEARTMAALQVANCATAEIRLFSLDDPDQGIVHVVAPEQGLTLPGLTVVCGDSHTSTHGAFGALAFGIGSSEVSHVLATQTLWQRRPRTMRVWFAGRLPLGTTSKDLILATIGAIGTAGATEHVIEFAGLAVQAMSMEERMSVCNMAIEAGARAGLIAPDDTTFEYLAGRRHAPSGPAWDRAVREWRGLRSADDATFDQEVTIDATTLAPMVTWGTSPEDVLPITGRVPDPGQEPHQGRRARLLRALDYMALVPGTPLSEIAVDRVFIGSCTNSRISDLRGAAAVIRGRRAVVRAMVVPGSRQVSRQAEAEGLDRIFRDAGFDWREPGCSMCLGMNDDLLSPGERCASTSNRNFEGRQGKGGRTHLVSAPMAAAAAVTGRLTDVRTLS